MRGTGSYAALWNEKRSGNGLRPTHRVKQRRDGWGTPVWRRGETQIPFGNDKQGNDKQGNDRQGNDRLGK
jgi:hypothetical protein